MKYYILSVILVAVVAGCVSPPETYSNKPSSEVFKRWEENRDYYALLEIVDSYIDPFLSKASKEDVKKYLGQGMESPDSYPHAGPKMWIYSSRRKVPYGSYLVITFDDKDMVKNIGWVSE